MICSIILCHRLEPHPRQRMYFFNVHVVAFIDFYMCMCMYVAYTCTCTYYVHVCMYSTTSLPFISPSTCTSLLPSIHPLPHSLSLYPPPLPPLSGCGIRWSILGWRRIFVSEELALLTEESSASSWEGRSNTVALTAGTHHHGQWPC